MELRTFIRGGFSTMHRVFIPASDILSKEYPYFLSFSIFFCIQVKKSQNKKFGWLVPENLK
jgi:hypothetical protein